MVELKVSKFGESLGIVLPKETVHRLGIGEGETLFLTEDADGGYRLTATGPEFEKKMTKADQIMDRYRNTLRVLAK